MNSYRKNDFIGNYLGNENIQKKNFKKEGKELNLANSYSLES